MQGSATAHPKLIGNVARHAVPRLRRPVCRPPGATLLIENRMDGDVVTESRQLPDVRLRPLTPADVPAITAMRTPEADPYNWAGHHDDDLQAAIEERRTLTDRGGELAVTTADGTLLGDVSWHRVPTGPSPYSWCWMIGISLLPEHRGRGYGAGAQRVLAAYLFQTTTAVRVEADTDVHHLAEQRSLDKAGFTREGVLRRTQFRSGGWHDTVRYSVLRGEL